MSWLLLIIAQSTCICFDVRLSSFFNYKVLPIRKLISIDICSTKKKEFFSVVSIVYSRPLGLLKTLGVTFVIINMLQT